MGHADLTATAGKTHRWQAQAARHPKILFVDQTGQLGGAEYCLHDLAVDFCPPGKVVLFDHGPFVDLLTGSNIPVEVLDTGPVRIRTLSGLLEALRSLPNLFELSTALAARATDFDVIVSNAPKASIVSLIAGKLARRQVIVHLHDILTAEHFSSVNRRAFVIACNSMAAGVITNSLATQEAFVQCGGKESLTRVVYNGFEPDSFLRNGRDPVAYSQTKKEFTTLGCFSRLSPWKGQNVLLEASRFIQGNCKILLIGAALFGEQEYEEQLRALSATLPNNIEVEFCGFRRDVVPLMHACDLIIQPSVQPEPFGRTVAEAQLCGRPVIATAAGGIPEIIEHNRTGWLVPANDPRALAEAINHCLSNRSDWVRVGEAARQSASQRFNLNKIRMDFLNTISELLG